MKIEDALRGVGSVLLDTAPVKRSPALIWKVSRAGARRPSCVKFASRPRNPCALPKSFAAFTEASMVHCAGVIFWMSNGDAWLNCEWV